METSMATWDLGDLYPGVTSPEVTKDQSSLTVQAHAFRKGHEGKVKATMQNPKTAKAFLDSYQGILGLLSRLSSYSSLLHAMDMSQAQNQNFKDSVRNLVGEVQQQLLFAQLEMQELTAEDLKRLTADPSLKPYAYYLERLLDQKRHTLSQEAEEIMIEKNLTGKSAFVELVSTHFAKLPYQPVTTPDGKTHASRPEIQSLREHQDRSVREKAYRSLITPLKEHNYLYGYALNQVLQDAFRENKRRRFTSTLEAKLFDHEVDVETFDTLMKVCEDTKDGVSRFLGYKAKKLGIKTMEPWDLLAPVGVKPPPIAYQDAISKVVSAAQKFSPDFHQAIKRSVAEHHIDADIRPAKRSGAFCSAPYVSEPYVFLSFAGDYSSLFTLAHELGHSVHFSLARAEQPYLLAFAPLVTCEIASIFNEFLLADDIMANNPPKEVAEYLLVTQAQDVLSTFYRQARISHFEKKLHEASAKSPLDSAAINQLWVEHYLPMLGSNFRPSDLTPFDWSYIHHIYFEPFYCYNYALSYAVSLACYQRYKEEGAGFVKRYIELLRLGGRISPHEALALIGIDLHSAKTYQSVAQHLHKVLDKLEALR